MFRIAHRRCQDVRLAEILRLWMMTSTFSSLAPTIGSEERLKDQDYGKAVYRLMQIDACFHPCK
jgi:hypothetical protein